MDLEQTVKTYLQLLPVREQQIKVNGGNFSDWEIEVCLRNIGAAFIELFGLPVAKDNFTIWIEEQERLAGFRRSPSRILRQEIFSRDDFKCVLCGSPKNLEADHIIPFSKGGLTLRENLQTLCKPCNVRKRDRL